MSLVHRSSNVRVLPKMKKPGSMLNHVFRGGRGGVVSILRRIVLVDGSEGSEE